MAGNVVTTVSVREGDKFCCSRDDGQLMAVRYLPETTGGRKLMKFKGWMKNIEQWMNEHMNERINEWYIWLK